MVKVQEILDRMVQSGDIDSWEPVEEKRLIK